LSVRLRGASVLLALVVSVFAGVAMIMPRASAATTRIGFPPAGQIYHAVFPGGRTGEEDDITPEDLESYEQTVGKTAAWVYFSNNWYRDRHFPLATATWIRDSGSVPFIRLMLRDKPFRERNRHFTLDRIIQGEFDSDLRAWAREARDFASPLLVEYGTEVNGYWFPWNGRHNGRGTTDGYGDPMLPDGPERFRDAYRHIIDMMRQEGASNIMWAFHLNGNDHPDRRWNRFENYYPGDDYIDWIGVSAYGAQTPMDKWCDDFRDIMDAAYPRVVAMARTKPIVVLEFGVTSGNPMCDQATWAEEALVDLIGFRWPTVIGFSWWNEAWQNDNKPEHDTNMRVQDNQALADVFQRLVGANENVLGRVLFIVVPNSELTSIPVLQPQTPHFPRPSNRGADSRRVVLMRGT